MSEPLFWVRLSVLALAIVVGLIVAAWALGRMERE